MKISTKGLTGEIIIPKNPMYNKYRLGWNRRIDRFPLVIVYCKNCEDVSNAINWAKQNKIHVRIRSGGHNCEGYSTGNKILVIDVSKMNEILLNEENNTVKIQGGVKSKDLYDIVSSKGYPFPGSTCPSVGVCGFILGGGWGLCSRYLGLGCDSLLEAEMINYEGKIIKINNDLNKELLWALQGGGGGNFGVITSMTFNLPKKIDKLTYFTIECKNPSVKMQNLFINIWDDWIRGCSEKIGLNVSLFNFENKGIGIYGKGFFFGTQEEALKELRPFKEIKGFSINTKYTNFYDAITKVQMGYTKHQKCLFSGRFICDKLSKIKVKKIINLIQKKPIGVNFTAITFYTLGGVIKSKSNKETAFYYRDAEYILGIQCVWENSRFEKNSLVWFNKRFKFLESITKGSYINFPYRGIENFRMAYYGGNVYCLKQANQKYDPDNFFRFPQGIG